MTRQHVIFLVALLSLIGSSVAAWAAIRERDYQLRGYVNPTQTPILPFWTPRLGVNADLTQYTDEELSLHLDRMQAAHITWIRQAFRWDVVERQPGRYQWESWDRIVRAVDQRPGIRFIAVLTGAPLWLHSPEASTQNAPPANPNDFAEFTREFAQRYGTWIDHYEVWDEPNLSTAWGGQEPRPVEYAALLQLAYTTIHASDNDATVLAAALAPTTETGPDSISDIKFLHDLYALGLRDYSDGIAAKPFGFDTGYDDRRVDPSVLNFSRIIMLREEMVRNGDGATALWASSVAWNSLPDNWSGAPSIWGSVTAEQQMMYTLGALDRAEREWPWLAGFILFHWQPATASDDPLWGFALMDQDNQPTPLLSALPERESPTTAQNGLFSASNPYARFSGVWRLGNLGADIGWLDDSQVEFQFEGQEVALLLRQDDFVAYLYPTLNGAQANALPRDSAGNAYIILTSDSREPEIELVAVARGLNNHGHTLRIIADRGQQRWPLVGFAVSSGDLRAPYGRLVTSAIFTMTISGIATVITAWQLNWSLVTAPLRRGWKQFSATGQIAFSAITTVALMIGMLLTWGEGTPNLLRREPVQFGLAVLSSGLIYLQPGLILTLAAAAVLLIVFYNRPDFGLTLILFWTPFFLFPVELYEFAFPMSEILVGLTFGAWVLRLLRDRGRVASVHFGSSSIIVWFRSLSAIDYGVATWLVLGVLSLAWSEHLDQALTELRTMILEPVLFYLVFRANVRTRGAAVLLVDGLLAAGFAVAVIGLWQFTQGQAVITAEGGTARLAGVYGSPNNLALFLGRCIPFALSYLIVDSDRLRRLAVGTSLSLMVLVVVFTQSVGAIFLGIPFSIAAAFLLVWRRRAILAFAVALGIFAAIMPLLFQSARFIRLLDFSGGTNFFRIRVWQSAINMIADHPLTGLGLDQFLYAFRGQYIMPDAWQEPELSHPHNFVLDFWLRLGLLGIVNFAWLQVLFWRAVRIQYTRLFRRDPLLLALCIGAAGSMINLLSHGLVDNSVFVQDLCYIYVLLLGLITNLSNISPIDETNNIMF